jgi:hypothetical protein
MRATRAILTGILLTYFVPTILSVMDILKGSEPDLSEEWIIVTIYLLVSFGYTLVNLSDLLRELKKSNT